jgi:hypothetical protein
MDFEQNLRCGAHIFCGANSVGDTVVNVLIMAVIYTIFFLSGAAALIYQVVWIRSLSLLFGGSHLAVATVLTVFMAGLALGGYVIGKRVAGIQKLLRLYGFLELGIAAFAILFLLLLKLYPPVYIMLAQFAPTSRCISPVSGSRSQPWR